MLLTWELFFPLSPATSQDLEKATERVAGEVSGGYCWY